MVQLNSEPGAAEALEREPGAASVSAPSAAAVAPDRSGRRHGARQALCLIAVLAVGPGLGWLTATALGIGHAGRTLLLLPLPGILFADYAWWAMRLRAMVCGVLWQVVRGGLHAALRRDRPAQLGELLPDADRLAELHRRARRAASAFWLVAWPIGLAAGLVAALCDAPGSAGARAAVVAAVCLAWGRALSRLALTGRLPMVEPE